LCLFLQLTWLLRLGMNLFELMKKNSHQSVIQIYGLFS
jgi:hypothetical protein